MQASLPANKLMLNQYNGSKLTFFDFVRDYRIYLRLCSLDDTYLNHRQIRKKLKAAANEAVAPDPDDPTITEGQKRQKQIQYQAAAAILHKMKETIDINSLKMYTILQSCVSPNVYMNIEHAANDLILGYQTKKSNPHGLTHYPMLRALWKALHGKYQPNVSESLAAARSTLEELPDNSSLSEILDAFNAFKSTVNRHPLLDDAGDQIYDTATGRPKFEEGDMQWMKATMLRKISRSNSHIKTHFMSTWTIEQTDFRKMFEQLQTMVIAQVDTIISVPAVVSSTPTTLPLPTILVANAAMNGPHNIEPMVYNKFASCQNCKRKGHYTNHCRSPRCETCQITFSNLDERQCHAAKQHSSFRNERNRPSTPNNYERSRDNDQNRGRDRNSSDDRNFYRDRNSRDRSRSRDQSRDRNSSRPRSSSPPNRRNVPNTSSQQERFNRSLSFANSTLETDDEF